MTPQETLIARHEACMELARYRDLREKRDDAIRRARELGVPVSEIADLVGLVRQHVSGILHGTR